jgi:DNA-binding transcriptional LysR family regulator
MQKCVKLQLEHAKLQPMVWDDLRVFLAVHRLGSHKAAARSLGIDATTVGRRIGTLETALGARLFARTPERLQATGAGLKLVPRAERMEAEALELERELQAADTRLEGSLRVTAADGLVNYLLLPALSGFRREHPLLSIELRADMRVLDLSRREADVAVRLFRPKEPALVARRFGEVRFALYASEAYLERHGTPRKRTALSAHDFIGADVSLDDLPHAKWLRRAVPKARYVLRANSTTPQTLACLEGHGIALLPSFVAAREPKLQPVLPRMSGPVREMWVVTHSGLRDNARTGAFVNWLVTLRP